LAEEAYQEARPVSALEFRIADVERDGQRLLTTCAVSIYAADVAIWPVHGDEDATLEVQMDDLLSHLTEYWKPILLRQTYPFGLNPARPSELWYKARRRWADFPEQQAAQEDEILETFADCHDLSRCFAGYYDLPPLWMIRSGDQMFVDTGTFLSTPDYTQTVGALEAIGNAIAARLSDGHDRWHKLVAAWRGREAGEGLSLLGWSTSLTPGVVKTLTADGLLDVPANLREAVNDNDELRLAARMASALPTEQIREILTLVRSFPKRQTPKLSALADATRAFFDETLLEARPFEQGEGLADFVRDHFSLTDGAADIFGMVRGLGVDLRIQAVAPPTLDALAVSGAKHGPAILLNVEAVRVKGGKTFEQAGRARVTLAHELCHLLIDGNNTLSAVDVLDGLMPLEVEQRARAFGAELLLPSRVAAREWHDLGAPQSRDGLQAALDHLAHKFVVTHSVAAWKLEHGARGYEINLEPMLRSLIPNR
jgi:hypothetical protein